MSFIRKRKVIRDFEYCLSPINCRNVRKTIFKAHSKARVHTHTHAHVRTLRHTTHVIYKDCVTIYESHCQKSNFCFFNETNFYIKGISYNKIPIHLGGFLHPIACLQKYGIS